MTKNLTYFAYIWFSLLMGSHTTTIKIFHIYESFGTQTQELKNSIVMNYDKNGALIDSTIYSHTIPLSKKYVYVAGFNEGLKLQHKYDKKTILSYVFDYDNLGRKTSCTLYGSNDSLYWKEFLKYDDKGKIFKQIRYDPKEAKNPEMIGNKEESGDMIWAELYQYINGGSIFEHKELYDNYCLVISTYKVDSTKAAIKKAEYFDPSVIFQTIFFHDDDGNLIHQISVGRLGQSIGSKTFEYDSLGRKIKTTIYNESGILQEILSTVFDDDNFISYDYYSDSIVNLSSLREMRLDSRGRPYIEAILDGDEKLLEKNVYFYDEIDRIVELKNYDMIRRGRSENYEIPVKVHTYEYE